MAQTASLAGSDTDNLRQRNVPLRNLAEDTARQTVLDLNAHEERTEKAENDRKTYGRTLDGTVFSVPFTHDMVSQLFSPSEPKSTADIIVVCILILHGVLLWVLPSSFKIPVFAVLYLFWRAAYNGGIGFLLHMQSHQKLLVRWAQKSKIFVNPATGDNPHPRLYSFLKKEFEFQIPKDYVFEDAPIEYNTWLLFRRVVDLILMCDFSTYMLFAVTCARLPPNESTLVGMGRWVLGLTLFFFNLWVKLDAHRVVKDYAWYWGDFFFLVDQELTFDGVFEMAPHPMYSIGYVGFYGISLMTASYKVLFISIIAHAAQLVFLVLVENPHIDRTYSPPPPRRPDAGSPKLGGVKMPAFRNDTDGFHLNPSNGQPATMHNLLGLKHIDFYRTTDSAVILLQLMLFALTVLTPATPTIEALFVANAVVWRLWYSVGMGYMLNRQSEKKKWTRHFLKYGESSGEAWRQWKGTYHLSMAMCYASFTAASWKMYSIPQDWTYGWILLRHVIGCGLVALQLWVSVSIYQQLGEFGWFYGDFFFDQSPRLTYGGIYRFLNNPERILGVAGIWGVALMTNSLAIFCVALLSHVLNLAFIHFVEHPHMKKVYGRHLRQDSGLSKSLRRSLPPPLQRWQDQVDNALESTLDRIEDIVDAARPKLADKVNTIVQDTKDVFHNYPARITITRVEPVIPDLDRKDYSLSIEGTPASPLAKAQRSSNKEAIQARSPSVSDYQTLLFEYGAPIKVKWTAPANHSKQDWVGLYMVADNASREVTRLSSSGRWIATNRGEYDALTSEIGLVTSNVPVPGSDLVSGEMIFSGDKLWWTQSVFDFRYHHNGKHNVMAISLPFEVRIAHFADDDLLQTTPSLAAHLPSSPQNEAFMRQSIETALLPIVQNCFDRDPEIAPATVDESFGSLVERDGKYARRVVYAVHHMFGIEFAPEVVQADGRVSNLAWRIWEAKMVLAPYAMSPSSRGVETPVEEKSD